MLANAQLVSWLSSGSVLAVDSAKYRDYSVKLPSG